MNIPEGANVEIKDNGIVTLAINGKTFERHYRPRMVEVNITDNELSLKAHGKPSRKKNAMVGALQAQLKNLLSGKEFEKKLKIVYAHFPISVEVKGNEILIKNFLGEKTPRKAKVFGNDIQVKVKGSEVIVTGMDPEHVGQTASNIVRKTKIKSLDNRVFQDGIYYED